MPTRLQRGRRPAHAGRRDLYEGALGGRRTAFRDIRSAPLSAETVLGLQATAGNRATTQLLRKADAISLPDVKLPEEDVFEKDQGRNKGDLADSPGRGVSAGPRRGRTRTEDMGVPIRLGNVAVETDTTRDEAAASRGKAADALQSGAVASEWSNPVMEVDDPFGSESFDVEMTGVNIDVPKKKSLGSRLFKGAKPDPVTVDYTIKVKASWGVKGGSHIDVPSPTSPVVTAGNYKKIVADLTPELEEKSWRAPRSKFWSKEICERHEKFHSTDDKAWAEGPGKDVVTDYVKSKKVSASSATKEVPKILLRATELMGRQNMEFYTGGATSYESYAGEERAFGDGKQPYLDLADGVKSQGEALEKAAAEEKKQAEEAKAKPTATPKATTAPVVPTTTGK